MSAIPFGDWLRLAVRMGIAPQRFWALSVREWRMLTASDAPAALGRAELQELQARYPD